MAFAKKKFLTYQQSQKWAKKNNITTCTKWMATKRPFNIPSNPQVAYKECWKGWSKFLGTSWMTFNQARTLIRTKKLNGYMEFKDWCKTTDRPTNFPANPWIAYRRYWKGYVDFLGNTTLPYLTIKRIVSKIPLTNSDDWTKEGLRRLDIKLRRNIPMSCFRGKEKFREFINSVPLEFDKVRDVIIRNKIRTAMQYRFYVRDMRKSNPILGKQLRISLSIYPQWHGWMKFKRINKL